MQFLYKRNKIYYLSIIVRGRSPISECNLEFSVLFYDKLMEKKDAQGNKKKGEVSPQPNNP